MLDSSNGSETANGRLLNKTSDEIKKKTNGSTSPRDSADDLEEEFFGKSKTAPGENNDDDGIIPEAVS